MNFTTLILLEMTEKFLEYSTWFFYSSNASRVITRITLLVWTLKYTYCICRKWKEKCIVNERFRERKNDLSDLSFWHRVFVSFFLYFPHFVGTFVSSHRIKLNNWPVFWQIIYFHWFQAYTTCKAHIRGVIDKSNSR